MLGGDSVWSQAVTWSLVIGGWLVINHQHNARETRKEVRAAIDRLNAALDEIECLAVNFHTGNSFDLRKLSTINRHISRLSPLVDTTGFGDVRQVRYRIYRVRQAITLRNADKSEFTTQAPDSQLLNNIAASIDDLRFLIESEFSKRNQTPLWKKIITFLR